MSDLISRQAVENITWEEPSYSDPLNVLTEVREKVRALPSVENKSEWIPVSERLPEKNVWVLVTVEQSGKRFQEIMRRNNYIEAWTDNIDNYTDEITAWMPLPEPYHETCKGCLEPCIMYEPDMRACKKKVKEVKNETDY